jgi:hypothetical protein
MSEDKAEGPSARDRYGSTIQALMDLSPEARALAQELDAIVGERLGGAAGLDPVTDRRLAELVEALDDLDDASMRAAGIVARIGRGFDKALEVPV